MNRRKKGKVSSSRKTGKRRTGSRTNPKDDLEEEVTNLWTRKTGLEGEDGVAERGERSVRQRRGSGTQKKRRRGSSKDEGTHLRTTVERATRMFLLRAL